LKSVAPKKTTLAIAEKLPKAMPVPKRAVRTGAAKEPKPTITTRKAVAGTKAGPRRPPVERRNTGKAAAPPTPETPAVIVRSTAKE
jgi:hypothetical protein